MRTHTQYFKDNIKNYGRQFTDVITMVTANNVLHPITQENINRINYSVDTTLLKSVMQKIVVEINEDLDLDTYKKLDYQTKLSGDTQYIEFKYFNVIKKEQQKDKKSYLYTCYDNMIKTMVDYETPIVNGNLITYPITIRDYINAICSHLGLTFKNASDTFTNYDKQITGEHYLDSDSNSLGYTFRDVLDDLAECVGGFICIDNNGQLEIRYITQAVGTKNLFNKDTITTGKYINDTGTLGSSGNYNASDYIVVNGLEKVTYSGNTDIRPNYASKVAFYNSSKSFISYSDISLGSNTYTIPNNAYYMRITMRKTDTDNIQVEKGSQSSSFEPYYDTINEDYFSDKNVNIKEKYGPINKLVTNIGTPRQDAQSITDNGLCEIDILDNPILDQSNGDSFLDGIFAKLNGLEYYLNDFQTNGILYYEVGDKYNVSIDSNTYDCLLLSDNIKRTTGLKENINTEEPKQNEAPYKYESSLERSSRNAYIIANKSEGRIDQIVTAVGDNGQVTSASIIQSINNDTSQTQIDADKIDIEANDVLNILSGNQINLTSKNISINSTNFSVDSGGNMTCSNANVTGGYLELTDDPDTYDDRLIIKKKNSTELTTATSEYIITKKAYNDDSNYAQMSLYTGLSHDTAVDQNNWTSSNLSNARLTLTRTINGVTTYTQIRTSGSEFAGDVTIGGTLTVNGTATGKFYNVTNNEQIVGTWIDGKPIYRKVIVNGETASNNYTKVVGISNLKDIINIKFTATQTTGLLQTITCNYYDSSNDKFTLLYIKSGQLNDTLILWTGTGQQWKLTVWFEYTKTTD